MSTTQAKTKPDENNPSPSDDIEHICRQCAQTFSSSQNLVRHMVTVCKSNIRCCVYCKKEFTDSAIYNAHLRVCRREEHCFTCEKCGHVYQRPQDLKRHQKQDCMRSLICSVCSKKFYTTSELNAHELIHSEHKMVCAVCSNQYSTKFELNRHMKVHTKTDLFKCSQCDKTFPKKYNYERHLRYHSGEKPFSCEFCPKKFTTNNSYKRHIVEAHSTSGLSFPCSVCQQFFRTKYRLKLHMTTHRENKGDTQVINSDKQTRAAKPKIATHSFISSSSLSDVAHPAGTVPVADTVPAALQATKLEPQCALQELTPALDKPVPENSFLCNLCSAVFTDDVMFGDHVSECYGFNMFKQSNTMDM